MVFYQGIAAGCRTYNGESMRHVIVLAASLALAGCSSMPSLDFLKPTPTSIPVQLDSRPAGADALTSLGPGCRTPCIVNVPATDSFSVTFSLTKYDPQTVPVQMTQTNGVDENGNPLPGGYLVEPSPVFVQLELSKPVRPVRPAKRPAAPRAPKQSAATPQQQPAASSAFPPPPNTSAFPPPPR
jgi:hypothetical protein